MDDRASSAPPWDVTDFVDDFVQTLIHDSLSHLGQWCDPDAVTGSLNATHRIVLNVHEAISSEEESGPEDEYADGFGDQQSPPADPVVGGQHVTPAARVTPASWVTQASWVTLASCPFLRAPGLC